MNGADDPAQRASARLLRCHRHPQVRLVPKGALIKALVGARAAVKVCPFCVAQARRKINLEFMRARSAHRELWSCLG